MIAKKTWRWANVLVVFALLLGMVVVPASAQPESWGKSGALTENPVPGEAQSAEAAPPPPPPAFEVETATDEAIRLIEPDLRDTARQGGPELVKVTVLVRPGTDLSRFFERSLTRPGVEFDRVIGLTAAANLLKIATVDGVLAVLNMGAREAPQPVPPALLVANDVPVPERQTRTFDRRSVQPQALPRVPAVEGLAPLGVTSPESFFTMDTNGVRATWLLGITGDGAPDDPLKIGVIDTGVDFANPDLFGTQARVYTGTYSTVAGFGWPIAFDDRSMSDFALDIQDYRGNWGWYMNAFLEIQDPDLGSTDPFTFTVFHPDLETNVVYTVPASIQAFNTNGGLYRFGWHPDDSLADVLGETAGVLVSGEDYFGTNWGPFDTIYVDIVASYDFADGAAWATLGQEIACVNLGWSAPTHCDLSGGMIYYISNGTTPVPASDWLYGLGAPDAGQVVAFMINDVTENGGDHGTLCAGTAIGQGQIVMMPYGGTYGSIYWPPTWYNPAVEGGISQGPAIDATLVAMGNYYGGGNSLNYYDFAALGYDGIPAGAPGDSYDQTHMHSNSYGSGSVENDGWDLSSRYLSLINWGYVAQQGITLPAGGAYSPLFIGSAGNSGYGYGTVTSPSPETGVMVAASNVFGQYNLGDTALYRDWVNWGQLTGMTDRGPTSMSSLGVHVMSNGFFGSGNLALNELTGGDWAVDFWAGTSRSGPEAMGILGLIYDAYYEEFGSYPTWQQARALLMNGARVGYNDPFAQGSGLVNALRAVEIIQGTKGVMMTSAEGNGYWVPGDYRGTAYPGFARGLFPGESDTESLILTNNFTDTASVNLEAVKLVKYESREWSFTTLDSRINGPSGEGPGTRYYDRRLYGPPGSNTGFGTNDPIFLSTVLTDTLLLQDADLMVIRLSWPFELFRNNTSSTGNWWFLYAWAWRDTDTSGSWFNDVNGNRVRNTGEFPASSETVRLNYDYGGNNAEIRIREPWALLNGSVQEGDPPLAVMTDMLISARHFYYGSAYPFTPIKITIDLYRYEPWEQLEIDTPAFTIPAGGVSTVNVTALTSFRGATLLSENFDGVVPPALPAGWTAVDVSGTAGEWATNVGTHHPSGRPAHSTPNLAWFNSWHASAGNRTRLQRTVGLDLSGMSGAELSFWMYHDTGYTNADYIQPQVSIDGGTTWINLGAPIYRYQGPGINEWRQYIRDLSPYAGLADVRIGFLGVSAYGNDCHIDDVEVYEMNYDAPGEYTGFIRALVQQGAEETYLYFPVQKQVWFPIDVDPTLGGVEQGTLYDNGVVFGGSGPAPYKRAEAGDWRFFYTDVQAGALDPDLATYLLAHTTWQTNGEVPPDATDIDTLFYGPQGDDFSTSFPALFGPSTLGVVGGSMRAGSAPDWGYYTTSGGADDWNSIQLWEEGLYGVAAQVTRWGGNATAVPYSITVGTAQASSPIYLSGLTCMSCTVPLVFKTNHSDLVGEELTAIGYGFNQPVMEWRTVNQGEYDNYYYTITADDAYKLQVNTYNDDPTIDIDLEVYYWTGSTWTLVGSSGRSDSNEQVLLAFPPAGDYLIAVYGYAVPGGTTGYWLSIEEISGAGAMTVSGLPQSIQSGVLYEMDVHFETGPVGAGIWNGVIFLGPADSPTAIAVPVYVVQGEATKVALQNTVRPGDLITYIITLNQDTDGSNVWSLQDLIPSGLEFVSVEGAEYDLGTNAIYWDNEVCAVDWIEATQTGTLQGTADDGYITTTLPFGFDFFGVAKPGGAELRIGTNGYATFGTSATSYSNAAIPNTAAPNDFLAPFWDDLNITGAEGLHYEVVGDPGSQTLVLQWGTIPAWPTEGGPMRYQVQLDEATGNIWFLYDVVGTHPRNTGSSATIGLENSTGTVGVQYSYNTAGAVEDNWAILFEPNGSGSYTIGYDDVICWSGWFGTHVITLTLRAPEGYAGYWVQNTAYVETGPNVCPVESDPVLVAGAMPTWEKEVWINGEGPLGTGYHRVADGDIVTIVDRVLIDSDDPVTYTLVEEWDGALGLQAFEADFGVVTPDTNLLTWEVAGGVGDTWYTLTKTFEVFVDWGWSAEVTETLTVVDGPLPETRWLYFDIPVRMDKSGPATARNGDVIPYTIVIESPTPILLDGTMMMTDVLPLGVQYAGNLTFTHGTAWYDADDNAVYWHNALGRQARQATAVPAPLGPLPDVAAQGERPVAPRAPQRPEAVLWDQPDDGTGWGIVSDFYLNTNKGTYAADDFVISEMGWDIDTIFVEGFNNAPTTLNNAQSLNWFIWTDDGGQPAGAPGDASEVWSFSTAPTDPAVTIVGGEATLDVVAAQGAPLHLPSGSYWLSFFPAMDMSVHNRWNWFRASTTNADWSMLYDEGNFGAGFPWTEIAALLTDPAWYDLAFRLEGEAQPFPTVVTITFDVEVTASPVTEIVNTAELDYLGLKVHADHVLTVVDEPIAGLEAHNDSPTTLGETTTLSATVTAGTNVTYEWALGDGETATGQTVMHVYPAVGTYTATVTATNGTNFQVATTVVTIGPRLIYLPLVTRRYAP